MPLQRRIYPGRLAIAIVLPLIGLAFLSLGVRASAHTLTLPLAPESLPRSVPARAASAPWTPPAPAYRIAVTAATGDGIYALDYTYLSARLPIGTIDPRTLRMFWMGQETPIEVLGEGDGVFDPGDVLLFFGRNIDSLYWQGLLPTNKYTGDNIYWLTYGGANGLRVSTRDGSGAGATAGPFPHLEHIERQLNYLSNRPFLPAADHWFGTRIQAIGATPGRNVTTFSATHVAAPPFTGQLTARLLGDADGLHHLRLYVNGTKVLDGSPSWSGFSIFQTSVPLTQTLMLEGSNAITVEIVADAPKTSDRVYLDWLEVTYGDTFVAEGDNLGFAADQAGVRTFSLSNFGQPEIFVYDVTDPFAAVRIINGTPAGSNPYGVTFTDGASASSRYWAASSGGWKTPAAMNLVTPLSSNYTPADLLDGANQADYLVITHSDFWAEALTLAAYRTQKYKVAVVDVQRVYDQFSGGMRSAEAIHDFLAYAYASWKAPRPRFVLLMGDGTSDMRNYRNATLTYVPPYLALVDPTLGETAADNRFVTLVGNDVLPDMALGRFPANTPLEAANLVSKTIDYETQCQCDSWNYNLIFSADNIEGGGGNFWTFSDRVADGFADPPTNTVPLIPSVYTKTKLYMGNTCDVTNPTDAVGCRYAITSTLNMTGALFLSFVGHGTKQYWAAEGIMNQQALTTLTNGENKCLPVVLPMTCLEGSFQDPTLGFASFGEAFVREPVNGAVASWSPTGSGLADGHDYLQRGLFLALFHDNIKQLGLAINSAKRYVEDNTSPGQYDDLVETFTLFGDPALEPKTDAVCNDIPTGVRLVDFAAVAAPAEVTLTWRTMSEHDVLGFELRRRPAQGSTDVRTWTLLTPAPIPASRAGMPAGNTYHFTDTTATAGVSYRYALEIVRLDGGTSLDREIVVTSPPYLLHLPRIRQHE